MVFTKVIGFFFSCCLFLFFSCNTSKTTSEDDQKLEIQDDKDYIMTVILELFNKTEDVVKVYEIITNEGFLKEGNANNVIETHKYLSVFEYNNDTPNIKKSFPDPLKKYVEYVDSNGNLTKKEITLESDVVPLRVNFNEAISKLKIFEREGSDWKLIASFPLNQ